MSTTPSSSTQKSDPPDSSPSGAEKSDLPASSPLSTEKSDRPGSSPSPPPLNNRDLSGAEILRQTQDLTPHGIHYAAETDIASRCEFMFNKALKGDVLVPKGTQMPLTEYLLGGIFQIDARNFFMTSNGKWNPNNPLNTRLEHVKATCHLLPVERNSEFNFSAQHFPTIIGNLRAIENLANPRRSHDTTSIIDKDSNTIKVMHRLFIVSLFFQIFFTFIKFM